MLIVLLVLGAIMFTWALLVRPEWIAILLFTLIIANINIDINGLPMNVRAIITLALFVRVIADSSVKKKYTAFITVGPGILFLVYMVYITLVSFGEDLLTFDLIKQLLSTAICTYCAYYFFMLKGSANVLKTAVILAGIICFADLAYTYIMFGSFPVQRIYLQLLGIQPEDIDEEGFFVSAVNHNFFGQICATAFIFILTDLIRNKKSGRYILILLPVMFLGVLMSTSRSALMGLIIVAILLVFNGLRNREYRRKVYRIASFALAAIVLGILLFSTLGMYFKLNSQFMDEVVFRLTEEPMAIIQKALGMQYNVQDLGSMDWREESAANAYEAYMRLNFREQVTGIGQGGFLARRLSEGLNPHNGILLILIESGMIGLVLYGILIFTIIRKSLKLKNFSPSLAVVIFTLIYGIGQNGELTSLTTFLFVATIMGEIEVISDEKFGWNGPMEMAQA
jgi:hypothetical protein